MAVLGLRTTATLAAAVQVMMIRHVEAHGGHEESKIPEGKAFSPEAIDGILIAHMVMMIVAFGLIFPTGMVLGLIKSRWHVPVQIAGTTIAVVAYFLGHLHKGRQFAPNVHASFATSLMLMLVVQVGLGVYLRLHLERYWQAKMRKYFVSAHGVLGKVMPLVAWVQMLFGGITLVGFCRGEHLGQCLAHFIMGSAFIAYGIIMTMLLMVGQFWLRRTGRSQEFFDSVVIAAWGCVNTFTEHRWGTAWVRNDLQHTSMGIVWWCAGLLGVWLSRGRGGQPKRNLIPGVVVLMTGWGMSAHPQAIPLSTMVHTIFGYTLMAAGATRIIEISFVLRDRSGFAEPQSFQHLPPFLLFASGFLFMGATEEQMRILSDANVTHVAYVLILYSLAFMLYLFVNILLHIYFTATSHGDNAANTSSKVENGRAWKGRDPGAFRDEEPNTNENGRANGGARLPRHRPTDSQVIRDAETFELQGLIDEDDDEDVVAKNVDVGGELLNGHARK